MMFKKPKLYFVIGALFLVGGLLLQKFAGTFYSSQEYFSQLVEEKLEEELADLEFSMIPIMDSVSTVEILKFNDFNIQAKYPYFVYRNQELKIWSDFHFTPEFDLIAGDYSIKLITYNNDIYIARKWFSESVGGQFEVVSLLPIYTEYAVQNRYLTNFANKNLFGRQEVIVSDTPDDTHHTIELQGEPIFWLAKESEFTLAYSPFKTYLFIIYSTSIILLLLAVTLSVKAAVTKRGKWIVVLITFMVWVIL
jgi:hypothetical protein